MCFTYLYALLFLANWLTFKGGVGVSYLALGDKLQEFSNGLNVERSNSLCRLLLAGGATADLIFEFSRQFSSGCSSLAGSKILKQAVGSTFWGVFNIWFVVPANSKRFFRLPTDVYNGDFFLLSWTSSGFGDSSCSKWAKNRKIIV